MERRYKIVGIVLFYSFLSHCLSIKIKWVKELKAPAKLYKDRVNLKKCSTSTKPNSESRVEGTTAKNGFAAVRENNPSNAAAQLLIPQPLRALLTLDLQIQMVCHDASVYVCTDSIYPSAEHSHAARVGLET